MKEPKEVNLRTVKRSKIKETYTMYPESMQSIVNSSIVQGYRICINLTYIEKSGYIVALRHEKGFYYDIVGEEAKIRAEMLNIVRRSIEKIKKYYKPSSTTMDCKCSSIDIKIIEDE